MRPPPVRQNAAFLSSRGAKLLIGLPLLLAAFALTLQWSGPRSDAATHLTLTGLPDADDTVFGARTGASRSLIDMQKGQGVQVAAKAGVGGQEERNGAVSNSWKPADSWHPQTLGNTTTENTKIAFVTTTASGYRETRLWVNYHRVIGVTHFYLFVDGVAARPEVMAKLNKLPGVRVVPRDEELKDRQAHSRIWNETWLSAFFHKPCNHELFVLQSLNMEEGIKLAAKDGIDWILHIDTDELMYPAGAPQYSLQRLLGDVPADVDTLVFPNHESLPERSDIASPFEEVSLFKRNFHHVVPDSYFKNYHQVARGNPNYFTTYGNGKAAARMHDGVRPNGAHRWYSYVKTPKEETSDQAAVLHYTYNRFSDLKSRRDRCDCAPTEEDAKRCFILPFDRMAFLAASMKTDEELLEWFKERLVWTDPAVITNLLKAGLFIRAYEPQVIMRGFPDEVEEDASAAASSQQPQTKPTEILTAAEQMPKLEAGTVA